MSDRARKAADRIREKISIVDVLSAYGYRVRNDGGDREQQFSCDLHGDGRDNTPSARVYPDSNSWYCFACDKTRDAIGTVMAKEDIGFWPAVKLLEKSVGLDPLPIDYEDERQDLRKEIAEALDPAKTFADDEKRVTSFLDSITHDRSLPLDAILKFWEALDKAVFNVRGPKGEGGPWSESKGRVVLVALIKRITEAEVEYIKASR